MGDEVGESLELESPCGCRLSQCGPCSGMRLARQCTRPIEPELAHVCPLPMAFVGALGLAQVSVGTRDVEDVVDDLEQHAELGGKAGIGLGHGIGAQQQYAFD